MKYNAAAFAFGIVALTVGFASALIVSGCHSQADSGSAANRAEAYASLSSADQSALADVPDASQMLHNGTLPVDPSVLRDPTLQPGLVVCTPVVSNSDNDLTHFGAGCAYWAQVVVGGLPELGSTPSFRGITRSAAELGEPRLALTAQQAMQLKETVAVPYAAVGTLTAAQSPGQYTLSYRLIQTANGASSGAPISLTGTEDQIISQLPVLASDLASQLGVKGASASAPAPSLTGSQMESVGQLRWDYSPDAALGQILAPLASQPGNAFLEMSLLRAVSYPSADPEVQDLQVALAELPDNADVYMEAATFAPECLPAVSGVLKADVLRYPNNLQLAGAYDKYARYSNAATSVQLAAAKIGLIAAPLNADAWTLSGGTYADLANSIRQGRFASEMNSTEAAQVSQLYPYALGCYEHAALIEPLDESAWADVAEQASFNGNAKEADAALRHALHLGPDPVEAYSWGMQMYQDKWYGTEFPGKLKALVDAACADQSLAPGDLSGMAERSFGGGIQPALYQQLMNASKTHTDQGPQ